MKPDGVLLLSATIYNAVLIAACFMVGGFTECAAATAAAPTAGPAHSHELPARMTIGVQEPPLLRTVIAASAALTLLYTPVLKQLTWIKNACVAAVVAASPFAGALAARAVSP